MPTLSSSPSTGNHLEQFQQDGYCVIDGLFSEPELREIEAFFEDYKRHGYRTFDGNIAIDEIDPKKRQVRAMHPHRHMPDPVNQWFLHPRVAAVLAELFGRPALGVQTMYYYKPPGAKGQGMHQDNFYLLAQPATCLAAWTPIDDADVDNGCLWVVPGSHRGNILCPEKDEPRWLGYGDSHITRFPRETKPIPVPVRRGQTMFFGGNMIHGSGPNRTTDRYRRTFIGHYVDEATETLARFYHPVLDMEGNAVTHVELHQGGGPCGDGWEGAAH